MQTGYICTCKNHKFKMAICCTCKSDQNVYNSKCCKQRISSWTPEPHAFCLLKYSHSYIYYTSGSQYHAKIACLGCKSAIFEIVHYTSGVVWHIDDLLSELYIFSFCDYFRSIEMVMADIVQQLSTNNSWDGKYCNKTFANIEKLLGAKRRFELCPKTFAEYRGPADYEMDWYDWKPHVKCRRCHTELNLHQCVDKSECKHIFCLACLLDTVNSDILNYVRCPTCYSYCAGTVEHYHTKVVLPLEFIKVLHLGTELTNSIDEAIENFETLDLWGDEQRKLIQPTRDRLISQAECYEAITKLRTLELPVYAYKEEGI